MMRLRGKCQISIRQQKDLNIWVWELFEKLQKRRHGIKDIWNMAMDFKTSVNFFAGNRLRIEAGIDHGLNMLPLRSKGQL